MAFYQRFAAVAILLSALALPAAAAPGPAGAGTQIYLPIAAATGPASPIGVDLRWYIGDAVLPYVRAAQPRWVRADDVLWPTSSRCAAAGTAGMC